MFLFPSVCQCEQVEGNFGMFSEPQWSSVGLLHNDKSVEGEWHFWNALMGTFSHKNKIKDILSHEGIHRTLLWITPWNTKTVRFYQKRKLFSRCILAVTQESTQVLPCRTGTATADHEGMRHVVPPPEKQRGKSRPLTSGKFCPHSRMDNFKGITQCTFHSCIS